jgi:hypothetical protein
MTADTRPAALQDHIASVRAKPAPLPLNREAAVEQALELRAGALSYPCIARVMAKYHGQFYSASWWRDRCRAAGVAKASGSMARVGR